MSRKMQTLHCKECSKEFSIEYSQFRARGGDNRINWFCSKKCSNIYHNRIKSKSAQIKKICLNCLKEYVTLKCVENTSNYCSRKCKDLYQSVLFKGDKNPNFRNSILKGTSRPKDVIEKIKIGVTESWKDPKRLTKNLLALNRYIEQHGSVFGKYKVGTYHSMKTGSDEYYHSSYELNRMIELDNDVNVIFWTKKHSIRIPYIVNNKSRTYIPDFLIEYQYFKVLEEVKGWVGDELIFKLKCEAAEIYCKNNNLKYIINFMKKNYEKSKD